MRSVSIERESFGDSEHLTIRFGRVKVRVSRDEIEHLQEVIKEFDFEHDQDLRECPQCYCEDQWERNDCVLEMRCTQCDHEEERQTGIYYNEEHEKI